MISRNHNPPVLYLSTPSPENSPHTSTIFSDCEADDEDTMSEELEPLPSSSGTLGSLQPVGPFCHRIPTLREILANQAAPPFTLAAFTAHLHQNHCLENLEFIKDAERYRKRHDRVAADTAGMPLSPELKESEELRMLWNRLLHAYIIPNSPREVNLSADVRDALISQPNHTSPPAPEVLVVAVERIMELMNESILMNFINEHAPSRPSGTINPDLDDLEERSSHHSGDESHYRARSQRKHSPHGDTKSSSRHPPSSARSSHQPGRGRLTMHASNSSTGSGDVMLTDDSGSLASLTNSPMTPPTTPPSSDLGGSSPKTRHDNTWKKMMGRLGNKKKSSSRMDRMEE
ncbi:MAG: hypothetical protein MMC23_005399 [Stictis urceolatum]|nr:hypothetical protein [Stictis urceolata]